MKNALATTASYSLLCSQVWRLSSLRGTGISGRPGERGYDTGNEGRCGARKSSVVYFMTEPRSRRKSMFQPGKIEYWPTLRCQAAQHGDRCLPKLVPGMCTCHAYTQHHPLATSLKYKKEGLGLNGQMEGGFQRTFKYSVGAARWLW
jgi:hypothetical protein